MTPNAIAGVWRRLAAFVVDGLVLAAVGLALGAAVGQYFPVPGGRGAVVGFAIAGAYFTYRDSELREGQTVGKWLLGIQVVHRDGSLLSPPQAFLRYAWSAYPRS